jgi:hypothetical protein
MGIGVETVKPISNSGKELIEKPEGRYDITAGQWYRLDLPE